MTDQPRSQPLSAAASPQPVRCYPSPILGLGRWQRVINVLRKSGTVGDLAIAANLDAQIRSTLDRARARANNDPLCPRCGAGTGRAWQGRTYDSDVCAPCASDMGWES